MSKVPQAMDSDAEDVASALDTAHALWQGGEHAEAIRWVQKAASAAEEAGHDGRALELARASADLNTPGEQQASESEPPAAAPAVAEAVSAPGAGSSVRATGDLLLTQAIRVSVKRSVRDGDLFIARKLDGSAAPPGTREALIVLLDSAADIDDTLN